MNCMAFHFVARIISGLTGDGCGGHAVDAQGLGSPAGLRHWTQRVLDNTSSLTGVKLSLDR